MKKSAYYNYIPTIALVGFIVYLYIFFDIQGEYARDIYVFNYKRISYILAAVLLLHPIMLFFREGYKVVLRADVLICTSFIYWTLLDLIQERYTLNHMDMIDVRYAFMLIALFCIFVQLAARYKLELPRMVSNAAGVDVKSNYLLAILAGCVMIGLFYFWHSAYYSFDYMINSLTKPRFMAPWARSQSGGLSSFIFHLKYFGYIAPALTSIIIVKERKVNLKVAIAITLTLFFCFFEFQNGARRIIGFLAGSGVITYLVAMRDRLRLRHMVILGTLTIAVIILMDMQLQFRRIGYENMFDRYELEEFETVKVDDNFYRITQIVQFVPSTHPFSGLQYLVWAFGRPIPRYFWESKPLSPGFNIAELAGEYNVSLSMTVVGEAYASYGWMMVALMGIFYGLLSGTFNQILESRLNTMGYALYATGLLALLAGVRSIADMIVFSYAFLVILLLYKTIIEPRRRKQIS